MGRKNSMTAPIASNKRRKDPSTSPSAIPKTDAMESPMNQATNVAPTSWRNARSTRSPNTSTITFDASGSALAGSTPVIEASSRITKVTRAPTAPRAGRRVLSPLGLEPTPGSRAAFAVALTLPPLGSGMDGSSTNRTDDAGQHIQRCMYASLWHPGQLAIPWTTSTRVFPWISDWKSRR